MTTFPYHLTDRTLTVLIDGDTYVADRSLATWDQITAAVRSDETTAAELINLICPIEMVATLDFSAAPDIQVTPNAVFWNGEVLDGPLADRLLDVARQNLPVEPWVRFAQNLHANPSVTSRNELYLWLEKAEMPITPDGCFIAYKIVRDDYLDCHSGSMSNRLGEVVTMPGGRRAVDADRDSTCSRGLHFCSRDYLPRYGVNDRRRVMLVKINPADVVSIPSDANDTKGRCWRYEVVGEIEPTEAERLQWGVYAAGIDEYDWDEDGWYVDADDVLEQVCWPDDEVEEVEPEVTEAVIMSTVLGPVTRDRVFQWLEDNDGVKARAARALGVAESTFSTWVKKLGL